MKTDLKKDDRNLYSPPPDPVLVEVPRMRFLMVDGDGEPAGERFQEAIGSLYSVAYTTKFALKAEDRDFVVMPLEGLFAGVDPEAFLKEVPKEWRWTLMIRVPPYVTADIITRAKSEAAEKRDLPALGLVRLEDFGEGPAAQMMHLGPYDAERADIEKIHAFISEKGLRPAGKHHEIYLSDPNRTAPERLKTIIRRPAATT